MRPLIVLAAALALTLGACEKKSADNGPSLEQLQAQATENAKKAEAFLTENAKKPGVMTLPSGVQYSVIKSGPTTGPMPKLEDAVQVNYQGALLDGKVFDTTYTDTGANPQTFPVGGLISAWTEALQQMRPGDEWMLYVPPAQGYGEAGAGADIPPNSLLVFKINLVRVIPAS